MVLALLRVTGERDKADTILGIPGTQWVAGSIFHCSVGDGVLNIADDILEAPLIMWVLSAIRVQAAAESPVVPPAVVLPCRRSSEIVVF